MRIPVAAVVVASVIAVAAAEPKSQFFTSSDPVYTQTLVKFIDGHDR